VVGKVFQKTKIGFCSAWTVSQKPPSVFPNTFFVRSYELCPKTYFSARTEAYISCHLHLPLYWQCKKKEERHHDLVPERGWEINLDQLHTIVDSNTVAMVIINPSNPCGTTFTHDHLAKVAETSKRLGLLIISDEVYAHIVFGEKPFIPVGFLHQI